MPGGPEPHAGPAPTGAIQQGKASKTHLVVLADATLPRNLRTRGRGCVTRVLDVGEAAVADLVEQDVEHGRVTIVARDWSALRSLVVPGRLLGESKEILVRVRRTIKDQLPVHWPTDNRASLLTLMWSRVGREATFVAESPHAVPIGDVLFMLAGDHRRVLDVPLRLALAGRGPEPYVVGSPVARFLGVNDTMISGYQTLTTVDVVVQEACAGVSPGLVPVDEGELPRIAVLPRVVAEEPGLHVSADGAAPDLCDRALALPPVDTTELNRAGAVYVAQDTARTYPSGPEANAVLVVDDEGRVRTRFQRGPGLAAVDVAALRPLRHLTSGVAPHRTPREHAWFLVQLAAAGIPVLAEDLNPLVRHLMGPRLSAIFDSVTPAITQDPLLREAASVSLSRAAMCDHGPAARSRTFAALVGRVMMPLPTVSVILVSKRPHLLPSAIRQIRRQTWRPLEIVLGLHCDHFDEDAVDAAVAVSLPNTVVLKIPERVPFGEALNQASLSASGDLLTKWDDDDLYGSDHVLDLVLAMERSGASLVAKGAEYVLLEDLGIVTRDRGHTAERPSTWIAGGTFMFHRETLRAVGGWSPVRYAVDHALVRQIISAGGTTYRTHGLGFVLRRHSLGHTWDPGVGHFLRGNTAQWRWSSTIADTILECVVSEARPTLSRKG